MAWKVGVEVDPDVRAPELAGGEAGGGRTAEGVEHDSLGWAAGGDAAEWDVDRKGGEVRLV